MKPGINIKKHRKLKGLTQKELASLIGKSEISVRKYEADNPVPSLDVLQKIASALSVEVAELQGIDTVYTVYSKLNVLNESQAEVEPKILETRSLINELISREHLTDIEKRKLDNYKTNLRSYSEQYLFVVREKSKLAKEFDHLLQEYAKADSKNPEKFYTNVEKIVEEPFWLFSKYVKKQFAERYKELIDNLDNELFEIFEKTNDYVEMMLIKENQEFNTPEKVEE